MTEYEKNKRITIPIGKDHLLLVNIDLDVEHTKIVNNILKLIANTSLTQKVELFFLSICNHSLIL